MYKSVILVGAGGCMREIVWQMQEQNKQNKVWKIEGYVDEKRPAHDGAVWVGGEEIPYLGGDDFLLGQKTETSVVICVGEPTLRKKIAEKLSKNTKLCFPNLILGNTAICTDVEMGQGCIISMDARISTNVKIGDFVFVNTGSKICHDGQLGDFVTLSPDVKLAGNVKIGAECELGLGTKVIQGVCIGKGVTTGAGSVVISDVGEGCTVVGVPARERKRGKEEG